MGIFETDRVLVYLNNLEIIVSPVGWRSNFNHLTSVGVFQSNFSKLNYDGWMPLTTSFGCGVISWYGIIMPWIIHCVAWFCIHYVVLTLFTLGFIVAMTIPTTNYFGRFDKFWRKNVAAQKYKFYCAAVFFSRNV